jgi:hypothetical protein
MSFFKELERNPTRRDLVSFGLIFAGGMGVIGAYWHLHSHRPGSALVVWALGAAVLVLSQIPPLGRLLYILWMGFGLVIGFFTAPIIMLVLYTVVVVPVGLWFKVTRRDLMRRQVDPAAKSYWEDYPSPPDPASYIRQF